MSDHDPTAAEVLDARFPYDPFRCCGPVDMPSEILAALSAAGLSVVRTGEVPAWMERVEAIVLDYGEFMGIETTEGDREVFYTADGNPDPLYVLRPKENQ